MAINRIHDYLWENDFNRTLIISILVVFWTISLEMYFLFFPIQDVRNHFLLGLLFVIDAIPIAFGIIQLEIILLLDLFHILVWSICIFFSWITYTLIKQITESNPAGIIEFLALVLLFAFFILFINNLFVALLVVLLSLLEFSYMFYALAEE